MRNADCGMGNEEMPEFGETGGCLANFTDALDKQPTGRDTMYGNTYISEME